MTAPGSGSWNVEITRQDGTKTNHPDLPCKPDWTKANLVPWSAISNAHTASHLDNLKLSGK